VTKEDPPLIVDELVNKRHTVVEHEGQVLGYDWDDVESVEFETPRDVKESWNEDGTVTRELGKAHLNVCITFKEGTDGARWAIGSK
jgi:hypothetical protein